MKKIDAIDIEIKFTAYGKTRMNKNKQKNKIESNKQKDDKESRYLELLKRQSDKIENEILKIKSQKLGRVGNIFKMKEVISGPKKGVQEPTAIRDPTNGELVVSGEKIKNVTLAYCVQNLTKKSEDTDVQNIIRVRK